MRLMGVLVLLKVRGIPAVAVQQCVWLLSYLWCLLKNGQRRAQSMIMREVFAPRHSQPWQLLRCGSVGFLEN